MKASQARELARKLHHADELYGGGHNGNLLGPSFYDRDAVYKWLQRRHYRGGQVLLIDDDGYYRRNGVEWKVPYGVRAAIKRPLNHAQLVNKLPWYVTWVSPTSGKRLKKYFSTLARAIEFTAEKAQFADPEATIVSRHGYIIPEKLRNKLPAPWKWCPCCMKARKFYRVYPQENFSAYIRDKTTWEMKIRLVPLLHCRVCGITNRDHKYRMSNQWWIKRKFKPGVRRAKKFRRS